MKETQKIYLGEYIILIEYDKTLGSLDVTILDELEEVIESISISNDLDSNSEEINPNLN